MAATFRVLSQRPSTQLTADGRFIDTIEITFETLPAQTPGSITVPKSQYTADYVRSAIEAQVSEMLAIESL